MKIKVKLFLFLLGLLVASCKDKQFTEKVESLKKNVKETIGKKLILPNDLNIYAPFTNYKLDSIGIQNADYKIYSEINASCGTCISKVKSWNKFNDELGAYQIPIILIFKSDDDFELLKYLSENKKMSDFPYPFFLDKKSQLTKLNKFMTESDDFKTVLTDKDNKILLMGNPIYSGRVKKMYLEEIEKRFVN